MASIDGATAFIGKHKVMLASAGAGVVGLGVGGSQYAKASEGEPLDERVGGTAHAGLVGLGIAGVAGATAVAGRKVFAKTGKAVGKRVGGWYADGFKKAFSEKSFANAALNHFPVSMTIGGVAGGVIGSQFGDPVTGAAVGVGVMTVGQGAVRTAMRDWKALGEAGIRGKVGKAGLLAVATVGAGMAARAYMHNDEFESESHAVRDGMGGYEVESGVRDRAASMNASADVVLGLHNKRHG